MNYIILQDLLADLEDFESDQRFDHSKATKQDFLHWLSQKEKPSKESKDYPKGNMPNHNSVVLKNLVYLVRFVQQYCKELWPMFSIKSLDEFVFLIQLQFMGPSTSTDIANQNFLQKTTTVSILKRLKDENLIYETTHPEDGRSKLNHITKEGQQQLFRLMGEMEKINQIAMGRLGENQVVELAKMTDQLVHFHTPIYHNKQTDLNQILQEIKE